MHDQFGGRSTAGTPWNPQPGEVLVRRRCITRALIERYGPTEDCSGCFRKSQHHSERCRAQFELMCAGEDGPGAVRAQEGQPAPPDPAAPNLASASRAVWAGSVNPEAMEAGDAEPATSSQVPAVDAPPVRPFVTGDEETMEQEEPESKRQRTVAGLPVCSFPTSC